MEVKIIVPKFPNGIAIGEERENLAVPVVVDYTAWVEQHGAGALQILLQRPQDADPYPVTVTNDNGEAVWTPNETDMKFKGRGEIQLVYTAGDVIERSPVIMVISGRSLVAAGDPPDPYETWLEELTELGAETQANAEAAQQSAENAEQSAQEAAQEAANAEGYAEQSGESASAAQSAEAASESARDAAQTAQASAESSATAASGSAASAAGSATAAAGSASDASYSATSAGASATTASTAATQAEAAKTAAQTAQSAAEDAAEDAQQAAQQAHVEYEQLSGEVDDLSDEVSRQKSAIDDLQALTNRKAGMLVDTASGSIASFVPDSTIDNLLGVTVDIEPQQDLHGYDNPWPGGGGVNKLDIATASTAKPAWYTGGWAGTTKNANAGITQERGYTNGGAGGFTVALKPGETYTVSWTYDKRINDSCKFHVTSYNGTQPTVVVDNVTVTSSTTRFSASFTVPSDSVEVAIRPTSFGATQSGQTYDLDYIQIELGSTATAWTPYSNICPISGWDSVEVQRMGVNVWDEQWDRGYVNITNGDFAPYPSYVRSKHKFNIKGGNSYRVTCARSGTLGNFGICFYDANGGFISNDISTANSTITAPDGAAQMAFYVPSSWYTGDYASDISINYPATDMQYHPYAGNSYTIPLGDTVYGGTLDATNGTLTVDRAMVDLGTLTPYKTPTNVFLWHVLTPTNGTILCSNYATAQSGLAPVNMPDKTVCTTNAIGTYYPVALKDTAYADATVKEMRAAMSGVQLVYELATPIEIQLDPVTISTISGQINNVWADAGDVAVEFAADLKHYIDSKIAAAVAAMS